MIMQIFIRSYSMHSERPEQLYIVLNTICDSSTRGPALKICRRRRREKSKSCSKKAFRTRTCTAYIIIIERVRHKNKNEKKDTDNTYIGSYARFVGRVLIRLI